MNYASKSGWSSIKEMNSPCNLISYGSLLCWAAESNCPWNEIYLQYMLAVWNGIAFYSHSNANTAPPPPHMSLRPFTTSSPHLVFQLQTRPTSEEDPECDVAGEPTHHAPLGPWSHVSRHDPSNRYALAFNPRFLVVVAKALDDSHSSLLFCGLLSVTHTHTLTRVSAHPHTRPASLPVASPQLVLEMAASPKWHMHPTTRHQLLTRLPKTDPLLNPRKPGAGRINWSGDLFSQISRCCILPEVHSN